MTKIANYDPTYGASLLSGPLTGGTTVGGDLGGTLPAPTVSGIEGYPISGTPAVNDVLQFNGSAWVLVLPAALLSGLAAGGDLSGAYPNPTVSKVNGVTVTGAPSPGAQILGTSTTTAQWSTGGHVTVYWPLLTLSNQIA